MAQSMTGLLHEAFNAEIPSHQNPYNNVDSVLSTSVSSVNLNNSSMIINSNSEDDKDTYCSYFFDFKIPELLDMNEVTRN